MTYIVSSGALNSTHSLERRQQISDTIERSKGDNFRRLRADYVHARNWLQVATCRDACIQPDQRTSLVLTASH